MRQWPGVLQLVLTGNPKRLVRHGWAASVASSIAIDGERAPA
jgi:hypothetical protein